HACEHRALGASSQRQDLRIIGCAFNAPVGGIVLALPIDIVLPVRLVVTPFVADDVRKSESVMGGDIGDRGAGSSRMPIEELPGTGEARGELWSFARIAAPKSPRAVTETIVPFGEAWRMMSELIAPGPKVPRLGYQLDARQHRILP